MLLAVLHIILFALLAAIVYQDFKYRAIHIFLVVGLFFISMGITYLNQNTWWLFIRPFIFVLVVISILWSYISLKNKKVVNPFSKNIGIGDVLFFVAITPLFSLHNYMLFFITGMIVSIVFSLVYKSKTQSHLIPLAGLLAFYLLILKATSLVLARDIFYHPNVLIQN